MGTTASKGESVSTASRTCGDYCSTTKTKKSLRKPHKRRSRSVALDEMTPMSSQRETLEEQFQKMDLSVEGTRLSREYFKAATEQNHLKLHALAEPKAMFHFPDTGVLMPSSAFPSQLLVFCL